MNNKNNHKIPVQGKITAVELLDTRASGIKAFSIDQPAVQASVQGHELLIAGWVLADVGYCTLDMGVSRRGILLKSCKINIARADVATAYGVPEAAGIKSGFYCKLSMIGFDRSFELDIHITLQRGLDEPRKIDICRIKAEKYTAFEIASDYQPLRVTALGRSGTTMLMQILGAHQSILTTDFYPYEVKPAQYWLHFFGVATAPADFDNSAHPGQFLNDLNKIGHNPFSHPQYTRQYKSQSRIESYYSTDLVNALSQFSVSRINDYYNFIASEEGKQGARYFAEKFSPNQQLTSVCNDLFSASKEIILTRDFRDMLCSARSFNQKRNKQGFGRANVDDDFEWAEKIADHGASRLAALWKERSGQSLHVKYENLVLHPEIEIRRIFHYLDIERDDMTVEHISNLVFLESAALAIHQTSSSPKDSIGRWKTDMDDGLKEFCQLKFKHILQDFGYEI